MNEAKIGMLAALVLGLTPSLGLADSLCEIEGAAIVEEPLGTTPGQILFKLEGQIVRCEGAPDCQGAAILAEGKLIGGTCAGNNHNGRLVIEGGGDSCPVGGTIECPLDADGNGTRCPGFFGMECSPGDRCVDESQSYVQIGGSCAGAACLGREPALTALSPAAERSYVIVFDDPEDAAVLTSCAEPTDAEIAFSGITTVP